MRHVTFAAAATALAAGATLAGLTGCGSTTSTTASGGGSSSASASASAASCASSAIQGELYSKGVLTVATDQPAYSPWFANNQPSNGQGYESAVAYAVAAQLGFSKSQVKWAYEPFDSSYARARRSSTSTSTKSRSPRSALRPSRSPTATTTCSRLWSP